MTRALPLNLNHAPTGLAQELYRRDQQIALLKEVVAAVRDRLDLTQIFQMVSTFAQGLLKAETVLIPVLDADSTHYTYRAGCGLHANEIVGESLDIGLGICGWVWKHKRPWWRGALNDLTEEERRQWDKEVGSVILVPMVGREQFLGGVACINKLDGTEFDQNDLELLSLLANQVAIAIDNNSLIAQLEHSNQALFSEKVRAQITLSSLGDAVLTTDNQGRIDYLNPIAERLFGVHLADARGKRLGDLAGLLFEGDRQAVPDLALLSLRGEAAASRFGTLVFQKPDGLEIYVEPNAAPIRDFAGDTCGAVLVFRDVSETHELTRRLSYQATHDVLTGLFNRHEFECRLKQEIRNAQVSGNEHSLLYLDLDQFKVVNDTSGHVAGDELLKQYTNHLSGMLRQGDILARIGGDEFGILLVNCSIHQAERIAVKIQAMTEFFRFAWEDKTFSISVSIGLVGITRDTSSILDIMSLVDSACFMAKEAGRNRVYTHSPTDSALRERRDEMQWSPRITRALEEKRIVLFHQPIAHCDTPDDLDTHYEILLRMIDESGALVAPGQFLPAAERYNLIGPIDRWVVTTYFRWLAEHPEHLRQLAIGSINLSGLSLGDDSCLRHIESQLSEFAIPPAKICFEITETEAIANLAKATHFIERLKDRGCRFALDDFGSGFSSYAYLKNLPVDFLKIDGMFVKDIVSDPVNFAMVESINHIGHVTGRKTIAEFVENDAIVKILNTLGVDFLQGYGIAKPRPLSDRD